jgi:hypothetical protein
MDTGGGSGGIGAAPRGGGCGAPPWRVRYLIRVIANPLDADQDCRVRV